MLIKMFVSNKKQACTNTKQEHRCAGARAWLSEEMVKVLVFGVQQNQGDVNDIIFHENKGAILHIILPSVISQKRSQSSQTIHLLCANYLPYRFTCFLSGILGLKV